MRHHPGTLVALGIGIAALAFPATASGASITANAVDGTVVTGSTTCQWADATADANPPDTAVIDGSTVSLSCDSSTSLTLNNDPSVSFDDAAGTATIDTINVSGTLIGLTCTYEATDIAMTRDGSTRTYSGGPYTGDKVDGSFLCPGSIDLDSATVTFH